jgi:hypothetical protein
MFATALVLLASFAAFAAGCEFPEEASMRRVRKENGRSKNTAEQTRNRTVPRRDSIHPFDVHFEAKYGRRPTGKPSGQ